MKTTKRKLLLFLFSAMFCGAYIYVAIRSFRSKPVLTVQPIMVLPPIKDNAFGGLISKEEYDRIERFKKDNLEKIRPSLMDSIRQFENIYHAQLNNSR